MSAETLQQLTARLARETQEAYRASPFSNLSRYYFSRFSRDSQAVPEADEVAIDGDWQIVLPEDASPLTRRMADHLVEFLEGRMDLLLEIRICVGALENKGARLLILEERDGGDPEIPESFTIAVTPDRTHVRGRDPQGLRDGIVHLVDRIGLRQAPFLKVGEQVYRPRLPVRLGAVPFQGEYRDLVFLGYNSVFVGGGDLYALSRSNAIPALRERRSPGPVQPAVEPRQYGLKTFAFLNTRQKFPLDHPVFRDHPDIRGALTWSADGEYVLCTEHPLVRRYMMESVEGLFRADPELDGIVLIIGGEGFYHCFMRPYGVEKGHTNCPRCEQLGAETVVANLLNSLAEAAHRVNPHAQVVAWPYSAEHVWSADRAQRGLIEKLRPGAAIFTEIEKDEYIDKGDGVEKHLWDYSIDLIGPGERASEQVEACRQADIPIYMKSEPELGFEAARLPHIPCMDRWADRAAALVSCGADGAWVFPAFRPLYGTSAAEINKLFWWTPVPPKEDVLQRLAARIAGDQAGPRLRRAWACVSSAIEYSPELPPYYTGPTYTGPAHPMCADPEAELPAVFHGLYLFRAEAQDAEGLKSHPTFCVDARGDVPVLERFYRRMEEHLHQAVEQVDAAVPLVAERCRRTFAAEVSSIRWFYHTIRTTANFYTSCRLRDQLRQLMTAEPLDAVEVRPLYEQWRQTLLDERANARAALPVAREDVRLDFYYGSDHTFPHLAEMLEAKLELLERELNEVLPETARRCGL